MSFKSLREWTRQCGVRRVREPYEHLVRTAEATGRTALEELNIHGFKDYDDFGRSCSRFGLHCDPIAFAEIGSGYVLYFNFLKFLVAALLVAAGLQVIFMLVYASQDNLCAWAATGFWLDRYTEASDWTNASTCPGNGTISRVMLTPGNLGPDAVEHMAGSFVYDVLAFMLLALSLLAYQYEMATDVEIDCKLILPDDFAILVRGLPVTATDPDAIADFFREHAVFGKRDTEIVKVIIGWDPKDIQDKLDEIKALRVQLDDRGGEDNPESEGILARLRTINEEVATIASGMAASSLKSSGTVVVVFRYTSDLEACLSRWTSRWSRWFYYDTRDFGLLPKGNRLVMMKELPRFPIGGWPVLKISIERAPNPGDIFWEHLAVSRLDRLKMQLNTNGRMLVLILGCFAITYSINRMQDTIAEAQDSRGSVGGVLGGGMQLLSVLLGCGVAVTNALVAIMAKKFTAKEYHDTLTDKEFSQALKMTIGMVVNTAGVVFVCNAQPKEWYKVGGLVDDLFWLVIITSILPPLLSLIDIPFYVRGLLVRRRLTQEKLDQINAGLAVVGSAPSQLRQRMRATKEAASVKKAYEPSPMNDARRFATALRTFLCCLLYSPLVPWLSLVGAFGLLLQYGVDKYLLLRWYRRPQKMVNANMALLFITVVKTVAPLGLVITSYVFLCPSWEDKVMMKQKFIYSAVFIFLLSTVVSFSMFDGPIRQMALNRRSKEDSDFYFAQYHWPKGQRYHKDHFVYKRLPESKNPEYLQAPDGTGDMVGPSVSKRSTAASKRSTVASKRSTPGAHIRQSFAVGGPSPAAVGGGERPSLYGVPRPSAAVPSPSPAAGAGGGERPSLYGAPRPSAAAPRPSAAVSRPSALQTPQTPQTPPSIAPCVVGALVGDPGAGGAGADTTSGRTSLLPPLSAAPEAELASMSPGASRQSRASRATRQSRTSRSTRRTRAPASVIASVVWQFAVARGWESYPPESSVELEQLYQAYLAGTGSAHVCVASEGHEVSIFFDKFTSKVEGSSHPRGIRRHETE